MQEEWRTKLERFGNLEDNKTREAMDKRPMDQRVVEQTLVRAGGSVDKKTENHWP